MPSSCISTFPAKPTGKAPQATFYTFGGPLGGLLQLVQLVQVLRSGTVEVIRHGPHQRMQRAADIVVRQPVHWSQRFRGQRGIQAGPH